MFFLILLSLSENTIASFTTCPQLYTSRSICEAETGCVYYDWKQSTCYYDCAQYPQQQCLLLFNCKWINQECRFKTCLDYTAQGSLLIYPIGPNTCANTPGCSWFWNKCRQQDCSDLGANTQAACSKTFCNWDETTTHCVNKSCADYSKTICYFQKQCAWDTNACVDVLSSFEFQLIVSILIILAI